MSRHTTVFTTDPRYRARNEIRNRLERLVQEANTTASCMGAFGDNPDVQMWQEVAVMATGMVEALSAANDIDRQNKMQASSAARLPEVDYGQAETEGMEPS